MSTPRNRKSFYSNLDLRRAMVAAAPFWLAGAACHGLNAATFNASDEASLRTAINNANSSGTNDEVVLSSGTYVLSGNPLENANASGDLDITKAAGNLVIRPATGASVIIDGNSEDRIFHVKTAAAVKVTIQDITIQNGVASDDGTTFGKGNGGGILLESGTLELIGVTVTGNQADGSPGGQGANGGLSQPGQPGSPGSAALGGGVFVGGGNLTISTSDISGNLVVGGNGGNGGNAGVAFSSALGGAGGLPGSGGDGYGGAIHLNAGSLTIADSKLTGNKVLAGFGGRGGNGGNNTSYIGGVGANGGAGGSALGGGISAFSGTLTVQNSTIATNEAIGANGGNGGNGGGGYTSGGDAGHGGAGGTAHGGGIFTESTGSVTITNSTISGNSAIGAAGGVGGIGGGITASIGGQGGDGGLGGLAQGGGVHITSGTVAITNCTISGDKAVGGNGGGGGTGGTAYGAFATNGDGGDGGAGSGGRGGGITLNGGALTLRNSTVAGGVASGATGGAGGAPGSVGMGGVAGSTGAAGLSDGGCARSGGGSFVADSTIFADGVADSAEDFSGGTVTAGACLFEVAPSASVTPGTGANIIGQDPMLAPLANNGGPTETHDLSPTSPARNVGSNPLGLLFDQRGYNRVAGGTIDIGALEQGSTLGTPPPTVTQPAGAEVVDAPTYNVQGDAVADALVRVYNDVNDNNLIDAGDTVVGSQQLTGGATTYSVATPLAQDAANNFLVTAEKAPSSESDPVDVPTITEDSTPPAPPTITDPAGAINHMGASYMVQGTAEANSLVRIYSDANNNGIVDGGDIEVGSQQLASNGTNFSISTPLTLTSANNFVATATDARNLESAPADVPTITETTPPPINPPVITDPAAAVTLNAASYAIKGTAQADSRVRIYTDANNNGIVDGLDTMVGDQQLAGGATSFSITVPLAQNAANNFTATATNAASFESNPADVPTILDNNVKQTTGGGKSSDGGGTCAATPRGGLWAMLLAGAGAIAATLRRRRRAAE